VKEGISAIRGGVEEERKRKRESGYVWMKDGDGDEGGGSAEWT
jgi:hypothetical protein